ncbi:regulatory iron-sulfur-containing complex subunit RicT [Ferruginibacter yonginensis]|uniref:Regulatory iron-sulfur-containing complex subunit RicT n=1 Tax=Ferruginibacter yonginensis TaxID=1310416 RepID=A0ABV8QQS6_9BACT
MACGSCGTGAPGGCQSKGSCSSGACNRMNVHDWLANLPFADPESSCRIVEVSFNNGSRKDYFKNTTLHYFEKGEMIALEGVNGFDVGMVNLTGELVRLQLKKNNIDEKSADIKKILRRATEADLAKMAENKAREAEVLIRSRAMARQLKLELKMAEVEIQADGRKATFFYIADDRVDFRELIKLYASEFKVKVEMRQIGARQEAGKVGGIGSCGRELCCATWLTDFKSVNTNAARYQNLSINQTKLSGQCGRLKCCLNYELDTYMDALQFFPTDADVLETAKGRAFLVKKDIFKNLMWYSMADSSKHYPLSIDTVKKIKAQNKDGIRPEELEVAEVVTSKPKEVEPEYADIVGQISLRSLEKTTRKRRDKERSQQQGPRNNNQGMPQRSKNAQGNTNAEARLQPNNRGGNNANNANNAAPRNQQQNRNQQQKPPLQQGNKPQQAGGQPPRNTQQGAPNKPAINSNNKQNNGPRQRPPQQGNRQNMPPRGPRNNPQGPAAPPSNTTT